MLPLHGVSLVSPLFIIGLQQVAVGLTYHLAYLPRPLFRRNHRGERDGCGQHLHCVAARQAGHGAAISGYVSARQVGVRSSISLVIT